MVQYLMTFEVSGNIVPDTMQHCLAINCKPPNCMQHKENKQYAVYLLTHFPGSAHNNLQRMICGTTEDKDLSVQNFNPLHSKIEIIFSFYQITVLQNITSTSTLLMIFFILITCLFDII